jgi:uncharacterized protein YdhG (YjbR/CyaY superfamily)
VHFAASRNHIGFYPTPSGLDAFKEELSTYTNGKGSVQFPIDEALPMDLVRRMVKFRLEKNRSKAKGGTYARELRKSLIGHV